LIRCEGVEAGHRLVQDQQLGALREGDGQPELCALAAGELPGLAPRVQVELIDPAARQRIVPARVEARAQRQVFSDGKPGIDRRVLGQIPDPGQLRRAGRGPAAEHRDRAGGGRRHPGGQVQQGRLPGPVQAD
jgi:hypothetical protein